MEEGEAEAEEGLILVVDEVEAAAVTITLLSLTGNKAEGEGEGVLDQDEGEGEELPIATTQSTKPTSRRIFFLAIDHADPPAPDSMTGIDEVVFATLEEATLSKTAMNELTCGHGVQLGVVQAAYRQVNIAMCGL